jgi:hypothetical protein
MEHWEFLLQKDGDRSWLPLDSPSVEILEGRYRIVVRSSQSNTPVEVRISHLNPTAIPPKRRVQKRSSRTNHDGLMVLIPYTCLDPGVWGFHCSSGDLMSELVEVPWQYTVQLQVIAQDSEVEDWEPDWSEPNSEAEPQEFQPQSSPDSTSAIAPEIAEAIPLAAAAPREAPRSDALAASEAIEPIPTADPLPASGGVPDAETLEPIATAVPLAVDAEAPSTAGLEAAVDHVSEPPSPPVATQPQSTYDPAAQELHYLTEQLSDELINEVMQELDLLNLPEPFLRSTADSAADLAGLRDRTAPPPEATVTPSTPSLGLQLDPDTFVGRQSETLTLTGTIHGQLADDRVLGPVPDPWDSLGSLSQPQPPDRSLQLYLRDPQSLEVLARDRQSIAATAATFQLCFRLPDYLDTRLILGEVQLWSTSDAAAQILATQTFTITVNPLDLVQELSRLNTALNQPPPSETEPSQLQPVELPQAGQPPQPVSLDLSFLASDPPAPPPKSYSLGGQPLPPQIYHPDADQVRPSGLHLPNFTPAPLDSAPVVSPVISEGEVTIEVAEAAVAPEASELSQPAATIVSAADSPDSAPEPEEVSLPAALIAPEINQTESLSPLPETEAEAIPGENLAFRALNLHDRFLNRLNALAGDGEAAPSSPQPDRVDALTWVSPASSSEDSERMADEVVNDEFSARSRSRRQLTQPALQEAGDGTSELPNPLVLAADEPVPTPDLHVTSGELVAGKPVNIRVRLPNLLPRIYVKLWINDRQTRSLLEGPRWLMDLLPNGHGALEATTQLIVPLGSLDIRFEAIAVEVQTQRESHKISVDRSVVPADLPALSLQDSLAELGD